MISNRRRALTKGDLATLKVPHGRPTDLVDLWREGDEDVGTGDEFLRQAKPLSSQTVLTLVCVGNSLAVQVQRCGVVPVT